MKAIRVSDYERDQQCEHGNGIACEEPAAAWTVKDGNGYVVACAEHARELVSAAVEAGEIVNQATLEPFQVKP